MRDNLEKQKPLFEGKKEKRKKEQHTQQTIYKLTFRNSLTNFSTK